MRGVAKNVQTWAMEKTRLNVKHKQFEMIETIVDAPVPYPGIDASNVGL